MCQMEADCANVRTDVQTDHSFRDPLFDEGVQRIVIRPKCDDLSVQKEIRVQQQMVPPTIAKPAELRFLRRHRECPASQPVDHPARSHTAEPPARRRQAPEQETRDFLQYRIRHGWISESLKPHWRAGLGRDCLGRCFLIDRPIANSCRTGDTQTTAATIKEAFTNQLSISPIPSSAFIPQRNTKGKKPSHKTERKLFR